MRRQNGSAGWTLSSDVDHGNGKHPAADDDLVGVVRHLVSSAFAPMYLRSCTQLGTRTRTIGRPRVLNLGRIEIGDDVVIDSSFARSELVTAPGGRIVIGSGVVIEHGTVVLASRMVEIGDRTEVGAYCVISDSDSPDAISGVAADDASPIWIGDDVVLGTRVTLLAGATIGAGAHLMAGSVVFGEIPPYVIAGGNPARAVRRRATATSEALVPPPADLAFAHGARGTGR